MRMLAERAIEMQKDVYLCFIDYVKAFDTVRHQALFEMLESLDLYGQDRIDQESVLEPTSGSYTGVLYRCYNGVLSQYVEVIHGV